MVIVSCLVAFGGSDDENASVSAPKDSGVCDPSDPMTDSTEMGRNKVCGQSETQRTNDMSPKLRSSIYARFTEPAGPTTGVTPEG